MNQLACAATPEERWQSRHVRRSLSCANVGRVHRPRRNRRHQEGGAAIVEFALVLPLLVVLLLGSVDMGFYLNDATKLRSTVRETARRAAVGGYGNTLCPSAYGRSEASDYPSGLPRATETSKVVCLMKLFAFESGLNGRVATRVVSFNGEGLVNSGSDKPWDSGNAIVVCAQIESRSRTGILAPVLNDRIIQSSVTMRIQKSQIDGPGESAEVAFRGDWSGCEVTA